MDVKAWIYLFGLWWLFFWLYRDYRLDALRQHLFALRDELFDLARGGLLSFDSKAYGMLRSSINGNIRFGHRLGFLDVFCFLIFTRRQPAIERQVEQYHHNWQAATAGLDQETLTSVEHIRTRVHLRVLEQIVLTSAVLMFSLTTLIFAVIFIWLKNFIVQMITRIFKGPRIRRLIDVYDCAASLNAL
jgi:hypothetical protein